MFEISCPMTVSMQDCKLNKRPMCFRRDGKHQTKTSKNNIQQGWVSTCAKCGTLHLNLVIWRCSQYNIFIDMVGSIAGWPKLFWYCHVNCLISNIMKTIHFQTQTQRCFIVKYWHIIEKNKEHNYCTSVENYYTKYNLHVLQCIQHAMHVVFSVVQRVQELEW